MLRLLIAVLVALSVLAGPAIAGLAHDGPDGCATMAAMERAAATHHDGHGAGGHHDDRPAKPVASVMPCCLAACAGLPAADGTRPGVFPLPADRPLIVDAALPDHPTEPIEPPPRPAFLPTA